MIYRLTKREYNALAKITSRSPGVSIWVQNGWLMATDGYVLALYESIEDKTRITLKGLEYYDIKELKALDKEVEISIDIGDKYEFRSGAASLSIIGTKVAPNAISVIKTFLDCMDNYNGYDKKSVLSRGFDPLLSYDWFNAAKKGKRHPYSLRTLEGNFIFGYESDYGKRYLLQMSRDDTVAEEIFLYLKGEFNE